VLTRVKPNHASIQPKSAGWLATLTACAFNQLGQCVNSSGIMAHCHAELAFSSLAAATTVDSTLCAYPCRDGQAELTWVAWLNTKTNGPPVSVQTWLDVE